MQTQNGVNWVKTTHPVWLPLSFPTVSPSFYGVINFWSFLYHTGSGLSLLLTSSTTHIPWNTYDILPLWGSYISVATTTSDTTDPPHNKHAKQSSQGASQPVSPAGMHDKRPWEGEGLGSLWFSESETLGISLLWKAFLGIPSQEMHSVLLGKNI